MKYIAVTIGPIVKTLLKGKKTKEIWSASYLFSYIMREIIREFKEEKERIIIPAIDEKLFDSKLKFQDEEYVGVGFFHDRFILKAKDGDRERLENIIAKTLEVLASQMAHHFRHLIPIYNNQMKDITDENSKRYFQKKIGELNRATEREERIEEFLKAYFQIYYFEKEAFNAILDLSPYLDMLELQGKVIPKEEINFITLLMQNINHSFLKDDAFGTKRGGFDSLPLIATRELHKLIEKDKFDEIFKQEVDDGAIYDELKEILPEKSLKSYHKYVAIVQADGDYISKIIEKLTSFDIFSSKLLDFAKKANGLVKEYGGSVVYAGGDDLLFFAPVVCDNEHIFGLLEKIRDAFDTIFANEIEELKDEKETPSLSFGLSVGYYKHPLDQALETAYTNLVYKAKKTDSKNSISLKILQHSGQYIETIINQSSSSYDKFQKLIKTFLAIENEKDVLSSFHHTIRKFEEVLTAIYKEPKAIRNFFDNNFNEAHQEKYKEFTDLLVNYTVVLFSEESNPKDGIKRVYTTLKLMKFLKGSTE